MTWVELAKVAVFTMILLVWSIVMIPIPDKMELVPIRNVVILVSGIVSLTVLTIAFVVL